MNKERVEFKKHVPGLYHNWRQRPIIYKETDKSESCKRLHIIGKNLFDNTVPYVRRAYANDISILFHLNLVSSFHGHETVSPRGTVGPMFILLMFKKKYPRSCVYNGSYAFEKLIKLKIQSHKYSLHYFRSINKHQ